ncbi:MAG TPA: M48 family metallopeptidase [Acidimicrobiales bacterium]|nr:M48 family metallopeptidase [Acidimicrobiales bacterium]
MPDVASAPVLSLDPVVLPAPSTTPPKPPQSLVLRAMVSVALLVGVPVLGAAVVLALVAVNVVIYRLGRVQFGLVILTAAVALGLGRALVAMVKSPERPKDEFELSEADEPGLFALVREVAGVAGAPVPDRVVLVSDVNAYVYEFGPLLGLFSRRRTLAIGTPLFDVLTVSQLRAVLAHEMGHFSGGDTRLGPLTFRTEQALARVVETLKGSRVALVFVKYWELQRRITAAVRRGQELVADRAAVRVAGRQAIADALARLEVAARAEALLRNTYLVPMLDAGYRPDDVGRGLRELLVQPARVRELLAGRAAAVGHPWASHPPTEQRIAQLGALPEEGTPAPDQRAARAVLRDPQRVLMAADEHWLRLVNGGSVSQVAPWEQWPDVVFAPAQRGRARVADRVLEQLRLPAGVAGLRSVRDHGIQRDFAAALIAAGWRTGTPDERERVVAAAERAVVVDRALATPGVRLAFSWAGPLSVVDAAGSALALDQLVDLALRGEVTLSGDAAAAVPASVEPPMVQAPPAPAPIPQAAPAPAPPLLQPPVPPFAPMGGGWSWQIEVPAGLGRRAQMAVSPTAIALGNDVIPYAAIASAAFVVKRQQMATSAEIRIGTMDGRRFRLKAASSGGSSSNPLLPMTSYAWDVLASQVAPRLVESLAGTLRTGATVTIGDAVLSRGGVAHRRKPDQVLPWNTLGEPRSANGTLVIRSTTGRHVAVSLHADNAFVLVKGFPVLRALFA